VAEVNLNAMDTIAHTFKVKVGYSDHTEGIAISIAAVALGATVIEKHFTLDRKMKGPDHKASLEPLEFREMVNSIRKIELAIGDGIKRPTPSELKNRDITRKSIVASKDIVKGQVFTEDNLTTKRPGNGLSPMLWNKVLGRKALHNYKKDDLIKG
jgi:N,N'-diacetyllegionaminate synthase